MYSNWRLQKGISVMGKIIRFQFISLRIKHTWDIGDVHCAMDFILFKYLSQTIELDMLAQSGTWNQAWEQKAWTLFSITQKALYFVVCYCYIHKLKSYLLSPVWLAVPLLFNYCIRPNPPISYPKTRIGD